MAEIDVRHIRVLEFPKQLLWTDRDLEYFLEEMSSEERKMNNDLYDAFLNEVKAGQAYSPEEALNLAYYECVRISLARYPESKDIFDVLEMDIQHNQSHVDYGFTDLIMNMVWAMLYSTDTAQRFTSKLHSYLYNSQKLKYSFRRFFTPNDYEHIIYPYDEKEEPHYDIKFTPCPDDMRIKPAAGDWCKYTIGYKEHLIEELLMLWPEKERESKRQIIMNEKAAQLHQFGDFANTHIIEVIDEPDSHPHINMKKSFAMPNLKPINSELEKEREELKAKSEEIEKLKKRCEELEGKIEPEKAFNAQTGMPCFTSRQMGILLTAIGRITEKDNPPGKTTLGEVVSRIAGYKPSAATTNMKGSIPKTDTEAVANAIESKFPNLAAEVRKV